MEYATNLSKQLSDAEIAQVIKVAPDPRGRPGVRPGGINLLVEIPNMPDRAKARMVLFQDFMDQAGESARSHVQHWDDVAQDVRDMLGVKSADEYLNMMRHRGGGVTAFDVMALRTVRDEFTRRTNRLDEMWKTKADAGDEAGARAALEEWQVAKNNEAAAIFTLSEKLTGAARALGIARAKGIEGDPQAMAKAVIRASFMERLRKRYKDAGELNRATDEMVAKFYEAKGNNSYEEFIKAFRVAMGRTGWRAGFDKVLEFFKAGLLGWPSEVANITSNNLFRGSRFLEDTIAAGLDAGYSKLGGKSREVFLGEAKVAARAVRRALAEGMPELMKSEMSLFKLEGGDLAKVMESGAAIDDLMMMSGANGGKMGNFLRFHFDSMQAWDTLAKHMSRTDTLYREIYRGLRKGEGWLAKRTKTGESLEDAVERIVGDLRQNQVKFEQGGSFDSLLLHQSKPLFEKANEIAKRDTFQAELGNLGKGVQSILREHPGLQFLFPFFRTPTNILKETLTRTPYGFFKAWQKRKTLSRAEMVGELSKPVLGSTLMALVMAKAAEGDITGGGPLTFEEQEALQATGWQPYSVRVGDQWISYARLEPIASLIGMAADAVEGHRAGDFQALDTGLHKAMTSMSANLTNKTFLSGLTSLTGAIGDPKREMGSFLKQIQQSAVPNSLGFVPFGHMARALDPVYRQTDPASLSVFQAKIPFMSQMLPPAYGPTGEVRTRPGSSAEMMFSPFARRTVETGPKAVGSEEMVKLGAVPKAPMRYWTSPQGFRVDLKPQERQLLAKALQDATELIGQRVVKDPSYQRLPKDEMDPRYQYGQKTQKDVLEGIINRARSRALRQIMPTLKQRSRQAYEQREL